MREKIARIAPLWAVVFVIAAAMASVTAEAEEIDRQGYTSAEICSYCHADIYESWKNSLHALSHTNPVFMTAYRRAYLETKGEAKKFCLKCHAPTTYSTGDFDAEMKITREGVTCDFCHTVEDVHLDRPEAPFDLDVGGKKRAAMRQFEKPYEETPAAHVPAYADWFNKAALCGACHEMTNRNGLKTGATYTEWKNSEYAAAGVQCQDCHMSEIPGAPVDPSVKTPKADTIPDHGLSHNLDQMTEAVDVELVKAEKTEGGRYVVDVAIANVKAGHNIPTGAPSRRLALEVTIKGEGTTPVTQIRTFGKQIADKDGNWLKTDAEAFLYGARMVSNTSLAPRERRVVRFMFSAAPPGKVSVKVEAFLGYHSEITATESTHVPLGEAAR
ncbi:MAG: multiheme c-type cytochrome [Candidatus Nitrospinota bacterium M3_3B_026]